ncbi:hypothetical protein [Bradyrhizobium sp. STM 3562]|uniref:hypothetical protein n=1 Tax=Bradyrhizobium sp. STM 3562 TaxID=578924 RepID=UPI00388ECAB0
MISPRVISVIITATASQSRHGGAGGVFVTGLALFARLEHDPEKGEAVFRKDHAQTRI